MNLNEKKKEMKKKNNAKPSTPAKPLSSSSSSSSSLNPPSIKEEIIHQEVKKSIPAEAATESQSLLSADLDMQMPEVFDPKAKKFDNSGTL